MYNKEQLKNYFKRYKSDSEIYHDLMQFKVREILLVATLYDAFILEEEDKLTEKIFGEYHQLNLSSAPRITNVSSKEEALQVLQEKHFDMVILTMRIDDAAPFDLSRKIKDMKKDIPIFLLLNDNTDIAMLKGKEDKLKNFERIFVWNRDSKIFLAMIKYIEDKINVDNDTKIGMVRVILLVEDSIQYYSRYLPTLYIEIIKQTQRLIIEEHYDEMKKIFRMRARPKVLMAQNYEEAVELFEKYKDYLLCVISDVKYPKDGKIDDEAGFKLFKYVKSQLDDIPILLQSSDKENALRATCLKASYINKNSEALSLDLQTFIFNSLGFGDFVFRDSNINEISRAKSMDEFENMLQNIPEDSLLYHANKNHFSAWLMARGEIQIAKRIHPVKVNDFSNAEELRSYLIKVYKEVGYQKTKGRVINFEESVIGDPNYIMRLSNGSLGGKGRGIAFLNALFQNSELADLFSDVKIKIPNTAIIGTEEFEYFMVNNDLQNFIARETDYEKIKLKFVKSRLSDSLIEKLRLYLQNIKAPIAVRSSSIFEDSLSQPFSGIYETFLLPNNSTDMEIRFHQLSTAVKLVFASVFSKSSRAYFEAINYNIEEERMAVVIQEVVGNLYGSKYYPHFSGIAQSYNYYPFSYIHPDDGIGILATGLGKYVVGGEQACRFCPRYPKLDILTPEDQYKNTQTEFYALNMSNDIDLFCGEDCSLIKLNISDAEKDGTLNYTASVWDNENRRIEPGLDVNGPRLINFSYILKYDYIPLAETLDAILEIAKNAIGTAVEIEFAVNLDEDNKKAAFYILQIKPLTGNREEFNINVDEIDKNDLLLYTDKGMGNGKIEDINDIIYVDPDLFDKSETLEMVLEIDKLNDEMKQQNKKYILIGPGRWGTRDRWLGIPILWPQISNAKIIIEVDLPDFRIDPSLGSHFFHNITSMNIGYFTVNYGGNENFVDWTWLKRQKVITRTKHFIHVNCEKPLDIVMDGRKSISLIYKS